MIAKRRLGLPASLFFGKLEECSLPQSESAKKSVFSEEPKEADPNGAGLYQISL